MARTATKGNPPEHIKRCLKFVRMQNGGMLVREIAEQEGYREATVRRMISTGRHWLGYEEK